MKKIIIGTIVILAMPFVAMGIVLWCLDINIFDNPDFWYGYMAYVGTIILGGIAVYQNKKAQNVNERLAKENNILQKISVQRLLPVLEIKSIDVLDAVDNCHNKFTDKNLIVVQESVTRDNRNVQVEVNVESRQNDGRFVKEIRLNFQNISESIVRQISIDRIEFPGFKICNESVASTVCYGADKYRFISELLLPNKHIDVTIKIHFGDSRYKKFWELQNENSVGEFNMCLYLTNTSISDIEYREKICIDKAVGFKEKIMYKIYEEEQDNA